MGIRLRGEKFFVDVTHKGERRTATCNSLQEAKAEEARLRHLLLTGQADEASPSTARKAWTMDTACTRAEAERWKGMAVDAKAATYCAEFRRYFGAATRLDSIDRDSILGYVSRLQEDGCSNATVNRKLSFLRGVFNHAIEGKAMAELPKFPKRLPEGKGRPGYLSQRQEDDCLALLRQWSKPDHVDAFIVLIDTGMRCGELWRVAARDVDLTTGLVSVWVTKNGEPRGIPMTKRVKAVMKDRIERFAARPDGEELLFPYTHGWLRSTWDRMRDHLGYSGDKTFVPHLLRHTCASRLVQRGASIAVVQQWLGHKTIQMTMRYAKVAPRHLLDVVGLLDVQEAAE